MIFVPTGIQNYEQFRKWTVLPFKRYLRDFGFFFSWIPVECLDEYRSYTKYAPSLRKVQRHNTATTCQSSLLQL